VQVDSIEAKAEETKSTKAHFSKKLPKHVTKTYLDEDQSSDVLYATVELELPDGSTKKLKGKVNTGAQVNLMNYMTFREIFGHDAERILHDSQVKLTSYGESASGTTGNSVLTVFATMMSLADTLNSMAVSCSH